MCSFVNWDLDTLMEEFPQIKYGSINLASTAWSFISMTTLALPFDKGLSGGNEQERETCSLSMYSTWVALGNPSQPVSQLT